MATVVRFNKARNGAMFHFCSVHANGSCYRLASTEKSLLECHSSSKQLVLFLHGWPESWYSWRHQLLHFHHSSRWLAVAPDMKGFGSSDHPTDLEEYAQTKLAHDVVSIAKALGYNSFIVVGHDWGAALAWSTALYYPEHVVAVCGMSVPYGGLPKAGFLTMLQAKYGPCLDSSIPRSVRLEAKFHYMLFHCLPHAGDVYNVHCEEALYRIYGAQAGISTKDGTPEYSIHGDMFSEHAMENSEVPLDAWVAPPWWLRLPRPTQLPPWMTQDDFEYITNEYKRCGFTAGLRWYQAMDINCEHMRSFLEEHERSDLIHQPSLFLVGDRDNVVSLYGGKDRVNSRVRDKCPGLARDPLFLPDCGHWIQQEFPTEVNQHLDEFLSGLVTTKSPTGRSKL